MKRACEQDVSEVKAGEVKAGEFSSGCPLASGGGGAPKPTPREELDTELDLLEINSKNNKTIARLHASIIKALGELDSDQKHSQYETFKTDCLAAIDRARPYLDPLDWNGILGNLALAILGLGVVYAAAGLINLAVTGDFLFFRPKEQTNGLKEKINNITQEPDRSDSPDAENGLSA